MVCWGRPYHFKFFKVHWSILEYFVPNALIKVAHKFVVYTPKNEILTLLLFCNLQSVIRI